MNVNGKDNLKSSNEQLFKAEPIDGTPFVAVEMDGKHWAAIGKWRITDTYESREKLLEVVENPNWNMIVAVMHVVGMEAKEVLNILNKEDIKTPQVETSK